MVSASRTDQAMKPAVDVEHLGIGIVLFD